MEDSQMAFDGQASNDMASMALDLETMMAADMTLSEGLDAFTTGIHDDTCLDHNAFSHCHVGAKTHAYQTKPPPMAQRSLSQTHVRQRHSISTSAAASSVATAPVVPQDQQTFPSPWDSIFTDSLLQNGLSCTGFDACEDNDCASVSCNSECAGSCPSQCGEPVRGVCCDDDACGPPDLCVDEECHGAAAPCHEPACSLSDNEAAAAVTLTTFGDKSAAGSSSALNQMQTVPPTPNEADMSYLDLPAVPCSALSLDNSYGDSNMFSSQMWDVAPEFILANHILQYHDPTHHEGHMRPCIADKPSSVMTMCSLPKHDTINGDALNTQSPDGVCGFQIQDPYAFAQHIFQQHRPSIAQSNLTHLHYHPMLSTHHLSSTTSPSTNISLGNSLSPTPASLPTPSTVEAPNFFDLGSSGTEAGAASKQDQYVCRWLVPNGHGGHVICGHTGKDHKDLQDHCKGEHLKKIKKDHTGFYCQWQGCTRHATFSQRSKLERHMQVHTGFKPVQCKICGAQLSAKQSLEQHMRTHTGEKPWVCSFEGCSQSFKQQSALTMHERTHTGAKPLQCDICGKKFGESSNLSKHRRIHNVRGSHVCEICGKDFHRLDQLRRHMGTNHKDRPEEVSKILSRVKSGRISKSTTLNGAMLASNGDDASDFVS